MNLPDLDHLVVDVGERLDDAATIYRSLGFRLTDRGYHTLGSANHLAMFATNYLELLGAGRAGGPIRAELAGFPEGLNGLVLATEDADAQYRSLRQRRVAVREPNSFSRPVAIDGVTREARFRTTHLAAGEAPFGRFYFCQHDTRDLVWRPEWQDHPNGARNITAILISAADPAAVGALLRRMFDVAPADPDGDGTLRFVAGQAAIEIGAHDVVARRLGASLPAASGRPAFVACVRLHTASLQRTAEAVRHVGAPQDGRLLVPAAAACNVALEFAA